MTRDGSKAVGVGRPAIPDELTYGKPRKRQTSICARSREVAAILGGLLYIPLLSYELCIMLQSNFRQSIPYRIMMMLIDYSMNK